jgi:hypothetical protein
VLRKELAERRFLVAVCGICAVYAALELLYVTQLPLIMDEYGGAWAVHRLTSGVPYRDFMPYKTILGYYIELPPLLLPGDTFSRIMYVKYELVAINTVALFVAARLLARHFDRIAVCLAAVALVAMTNFLERSAELRVDMLTAWFGLFSLLALLDRRMLLAGILLAASFLTSQKGVYYAAATAAALLCYCAFVERTRRAVRDAIVCGGVAAAIVGAYFGVFGLLGRSVGGVGTQVLSAPKEIAFERIYLEVRDYWFQSLERNPFFYGALFAGIGSAFARRFERRTEAILWIYGLTVLAGCLWHRQPWPYFFVILAPTGFVMIAALLDGEVRRAGRVTVPAIAVLALFGVAYPLSRVPANLERDVGPQRTAVRIADRILADGEAYLDGAAMIFDHPQPRLLASLGRARLKALRSEDSRRLIADIEQSRVKLLIMNYRLKGLPRSVSAYLDRNYARLYGNVNIYCPTVDAGARRAEIWFAGEYSVRTARGATAAGAVEIDGRGVGAGGKLRLARGEHSIAADGAFRLCLEPAGWRDVADPAHARPVDLYPDPYTY